MRNKELVRIIRCRKCGRPIAYEWKVSGFGSWRTTIESTPDRYKNRDICVRCKG